MNDTVVNEEEEGSTYEDDFEAFAAGEQVPEADPEPASEASTDDEDESPSTKDPDDGDDSPQSKGSEKSKEDDPYAWIEDLPEDFRQQAEALKHESVSNRGRVRSYQSQLDEMRARQAARERAAQEAAAKGPAATLEGKEPEEDDEIAKQIKEDYPELAAYLDKKQQQARDEAIAEINAKVGPLLEEQQVSKSLAAKQDFESRAAEVFMTDEGGPHWEDAVKSPEFKDYYGTLTAEEKKLVHSADPATAANALARFVEHARTLYNKEKKTETPKTQNKDKREKLSRQAIPESRSAVTDNDGSFGSYEDDFNRFADKM